MDTGDTLGTLRSAQIERHGHVVAEDGRLTPHDGLVTVGLPTFNRRVAAMKAARSVVHQSYRPLHLIVVDNASDDGTAREIERLTSEFNEVSLFINEMNIGPSANFERVRDEASGEFFMWLGDDDWLDANYIDNCVRELNADHQTVMVAGACRYHSVNSVWLESPRVNVLQNCGTDRVLEYFRSVTSNGVFYGVARREILIGLPPVPNVMGGDWLHMARLAFLGRIKTLDQVEVHRSVGGATRSLANVAKHQQLGWLSRNAPQIALAWVTLADIGWRSSVYASLGRQRRLALGGRSACIVISRFLPGAIAKFLRTKRNSASDVQLDPEPQPPTRTQS